jgi:prevent-host-death family protein
MKTASVTEVASDFAAWLKASKQGPVVVTRNGKPVAVLLDAADQEDLERLLMGHSPALQSILEAARNRFRAGRGVPHEEFWKEIEKPKSRPARKQPGTRKNGRTGR